jgi:hypothetical protein
MEPNADNDANFGTSCTQCGCAIRGRSASGLCPECGLLLKDWAAGEASPRADSRRSFALGLASVVLVTGSCCTGVTLPRSKSYSPSSGAGTALPFVLHAIILVLGGWAALRAIRFGGLISQLAGSLALIVTCLFVVMHVSDWIDALRK